LVLDKFDLLDNNHQIPEFRCIGDAVLGPKKLNQSIT